MTAAGNPSGFCRGDFTGRANLQRGLCRIEEVRMMSLGEKIAGACHTREPFGRWHGTLRQNKFFLF